MDFFFKKIIIFFHLSKRNVFLPVSYTKINFFKLVIKNVLTLKTSTFKYVIITGLVIFFVACSTKKNNFVSRNSHALSTKYNILYNGGVALDKGIVDLKSQYKDNFWEILPVERMQVKEDQMMPGETKNANFDRAEEKATKAIQKHSMNIDGSEKNPQMDEAHLMLGKSRYYDQRFVPALEAFNYVLYKYPESDKIYEVKIWREKTNMRLENDALAVENLRKLLKEIKFKDQIFADANATLAQAFLNLKQKDSAIAKLKIATDFTKQNEEKARYRFILAQIYDELGYKDSAYAKYQEVIDMKRKAARQYVIQSHARQALQFDAEKGDTIAFLEKYKDLLKDRENRPHLDVLNHQMGLFYDKMHKPDAAKKYYNISLKSKSQDDYLIASNYRNLGEIFFNKAKYETAGKYYDSTLAVLNPRTREFKLISKKRENLADVIKFEAIAQRNDSILKMAAMSPSEKESYYKDFIEKLKKEDEKQKQLAERDAKLKEQQGNDVVETKGGKSAPKEEASTDPVSKSATASTFYFYNPSTVAYGRLEFKKKWGNRALVENWRLSKEKISENKEDENSDVASSDKKSEKENEKYTTDFYIKQIPSDAKVLDSLSKERNFAYYQLGVIYKEKFKEYKRAADKLEKLLTNNPEERLVLPSLYNLFKIYEIIDKDKAAAMKSRIVSQYPDSRYAQILNKDAMALGFGTPEVTYKKLYEDYESGLYRETLVKTDMAIVQFTGEEILSKFELLKANLIGKLHGLAEFKKALNFVALTYPNSTEGKETEAFLSAKMPYLESLSFNSEVPLSWNILYKADDLNDKGIKTLLEKLNKFAKERTIEKLSISTDIYTIDKNFIVVHGIKTIENAKGIAQVLKEFKDYKIPNQAIIISSENYKVVQVKKNIDEYISGDWLNKEIVPIKRTLALPENNDEKGQKAAKVLTKEDIKNALQSSSKEEPKAPSQTTTNPLDTKDDKPNQTMMPPVKTTMPGQQNMTPGQQTMTPGQQMMPPSPGMPKR